MPTTQAIRRARNRKLRRAASAASELPIFRRERELVKRSRRPLPSPTPRRMSVLSGDPHGQCGDRIARRAHLRSACRPNHDRSAGFFAVRALGMPEAYWAMVTALVVMQSSVGAAWKVSRQRFAGTALGAMVGGALASYFGSNLFVFAAAIFGTGLVCLALHLDRAAYHRGHHHASRTRLDYRRSPLRGVSLGIAVALVLTAVWPERPHAPRSR